MSFLILSTLLVVSIVMLFLTDSTIISGISMSYIAAYVFYLINEVLPTSRKCTTEKVLVYRKLQILLVRLDSIFEEVLEVSKRPRKLKEYKLDEFFSKEVLQSCLVGFDDNQDGISVSFSQPYKAIKCSDHFLSLWKEIRDYGQSICETNCMAYDKTELVYCISYLINESSISHYFAIKSRRIRSEFGCILSLNQIDTQYFSEAVMNIKKLHRIAFSLYDSLKRKKKYRHIVYEPYFYSQERN